MMPGANQTILSELGTLFIDHKASIKKVKKIEKPQKVINKKRSIQKIKVPVDIGHLPIDVLLLFQAGIPSLEKAVRSFSSHFTKLSDFNNYKYEDLRELRGLGVNKVDPVWEWFSNLNIDLSYRDLEPHIKAERNTLDEMHFSYFAKELFQLYNIQELSEIQNIVKINSHDLPYRLQVTILEVRTFYFDDVIGKISSRANNTTKTINLKGDLDDFYTNGISEKEIEFANQRWHCEECLTLEEIGKKHNITRERVRQIKARILDKFKSNYIVDYNYLLEILYHKLYNNLSYLKFEDLGHGEYEHQLNKNVYLKFFSELFKPLPFDKRSIATFQQPKYSAIKKKIRNATSIPYQYRLDDALKDENLLEKIYILSYLIDEDGDYIISTLDGVRYINRKRYSSNTLAQYIIKNTDRVISINKINEEIEKLGGKKQEPLGLLGRLKNVEGIYDLDYHIMGTIENFGYPKSEWSRIQKDCLKIINDYGHQVHVAFIYKDIKSSYPKIRSKYELVFILQDSNEIDYIKPHNFTLEKFGNRKNKLVDEIAIKILKKVEHPIHAGELYNEINKERSYTREGMTTLHKQNNYIELYQPAFYGLTINHNENLQYLSKHIPYIENYLQWKSAMNEDFRISKVITDICFSGTEDQFCELIERGSGLLTINTVNENNYEKYLLHKGMSVRKMAIVILATHKRPMMYSELLIILRNTYAINKPKRQFKYIDSYLSKHPRIIVDKNLFIYNPMVDKYNKYLDLLESIINTLNDWSDYIRIEELYDLIEEEPLRPKNSGLLLGLLKLDDRIEIIDNSLITVKENV